MTSDAIQKLREVRAFDQYPAPDHLQQYHVPFEDIVPGEVVESRLHELALNRERIGLVGRSGAGKSSAIAYAFGPLVEGIAPVIVPIRSEDPAVASDVKAFARHVVQMLGRSLVHARKIDESQLRELRAAASTETRSRTVNSPQAQIGLPSWLLDAGITSGMSAVVAQFDDSKSTAEVVDVARRALGVLESRDLVPILIIDDSDAWLARPGAKTEEATIARFFGETLRVVTDLPCALVVAVHEGYLDLDGYPQHTGIIDQQIRIPRLPDVECLGRLVEGRAQCCDVVVPASEILTDSALDQVYDYYRSDVGAFSIRRVMLLLHSALDHANQGLADVIGPSDLDAALSVMP